jgi:hypothetical protein
LKPPRARNGLVLRAKRALRRRETAWGMGLLSAEKRALCAFLMS